MMAARVVEANLRYKFTEDDLIAIMWSTFCREDRYLRGRWMMTGNIFTGLHDYSEEFVRKYADTKGYLIRDLAVINMTTNYLKTIPATSITMASVPYNYQQDLEDSTIQPILDLHRDTINSTPPSLLELEMNGQWESGHHYYDPNCGADPDWGDYHPNPVRYYNYLKKIGLPMTEVSQKYAEDSLVELRKIKTRAELDVNFPEIKPSKERLIL